MLKSWKSITINERSALDRSDFVVHAAGNYPDIIRPRYAIVVVSVVKR